jgi:DNA-binding CsgD family transcriptional regulator/tetratricopeptide (TPR) repeat protein
VTAGPDHRHPRDLGRTDGDDAPAGRPRLRHGALVGRDGELARLSDLLDSASSGRGCTAVIEGEAGIGKTALLGAVQRAAKPRFTCWLDATADELDRRVPYAVLSSCLEPLADSEQRVRDLLGHIGRGKGGESEYAVTESVLTLVDEWCAKGPVLLAFDDIQWADPPTLRLLERVGREAEQLPLLLVATCRTGAAEPGADRLLRRWQAQRSARITLSPLDEREVDSWLGQVLGSRPGPRLRELVAGAAGNPLYLTELLDGLDLDRRLEPGGTDAATVDLIPGTSTVPSTLTEAIRHRLRQLTAPTREALQVAALLGGSFAVADLAAVLGRPATDLLGSISEASRAGVLSSDDGLTFRHPMVRTVLVQDLPASARSALHAQIAQALAEIRAPAVKVADHLLAAGPGATAMLPWLADAASALVRTAPALAADVLRQGLAAADDSGRPTDPRLTVALPQALLRTGEPGRAERAARAALAAAGGPPALRWLLALACVGQGQTDRAVEEITTALAVGGLTPAEQARFHGLAAQCHVTLGDAVAAAAAWHEGLAAARASGDTRALAHALQAACSARAWDGWIEEALGYAEAAARATDALGDVAGAQLAPQVARALCLVELGRDADADAALEAALRAAQQGTGTDFLGWRHQIVARLRYVQGRWDESLAAVHEGLELPDRFDMARHLRAVAALIAVHRGDRAAVAELIPPLRAGAPATSPGNASWAGPTWALAQAEAAEGRPGAATELLGPVWCVRGERDQLRYLRHYLVPDLVAWAMDAGDGDLAQGAAAALTGYAAARPTPSIGRSARFAAALAGRDAPALLEVADQYEANGRPLFAAQARERAAQYLADAGDAGAARTALRAAYDAFEGFEATWDASRVDAQLRALGARRGVRGPRRRPKFGWEALTDTERTVAELVAEGYSNPQIGERMFLSRRTVQGHVSSILTKLSLTSRVEVATALVRHLSGIEDTTAGAQDPQP